MIQKLYDLDRFIFFTTGETWSIRRGIEENRERASRTSNVLRQWNQGFRASADYF